MSADRPEIAIAAGIWAVGVVAFAVYAAKFEAAAGGLVGSTALFALLFAPYGALSVVGWVERLRSWLAAGGLGSRPRAALLWILAVAVCGVYAGRAALQPALLAVGLVAIGLTRAGRALERAPLRSAAAILILWLPLELALLPRLDLPAGAGKASLDAAYLLVFDLALLLFVVVAAQRDVGYRFVIGRANVRPAGLAFLAFAVVAIPLGLASGFVRAHWWGRGPLDAVVAALDIYFVTAVPEEFLFRGLIQNLIQKRWPARPRITLAAAAVIFGLSHLDNPPAPDFRYAALATLAGLAYGWVWMRTRKVTAAALTHAAVDLVWVMWFGR